MRFKSITKNISILAIAGLLSVSFAMAESVSTRQLALEKESIKLIGQMEDVARDIQYNADRLNALSVPARTSKWSQDHHLMQIKELVNQGLNPALGRLLEIQPQLKDWQQDSINKMLASAKALAGDTNSAILTNNDSQRRAPGQNGGYRELIARIDEHAQTLVKTSDAAGDYAVAQKQALEAGLNVPKT